MWEAVHGPIPSGMNVCHTCDNPPCVRPDHLFLGSHAVNQRDRKAKGRSGYGEHNGRAKLTDEDVVGIRQQYASGLATQRQLSQEHGVSQRMISKIVRREAWTHLS